MAGRLGDILVDREIITEAQLHAALQAQGTGRGMLGEILLRQGLVTNNQLGDALSEQFEVPFHEIVPEAINAQIVRLLPETLSRQRNMVPIEVEGDCMTLAMVAPDDIETISEAELITGYRIQPVVSLGVHVDAALDRGFDERLVARQTIADMKMAELKEAAGDRAQLASPEGQDTSAPVVRLVQAILMGAINGSASDIHLEPHTPEMRVRYRVDGELKEVMTIPNHIEEAVVARIKVMADMNTTETRRPQDGNLRVEEAGGSANIRVSTIPTVGGEKVVLRILDDANKSFHLDNIGLAPKQREIVQKLVDRPYGMLVVTGPTGSGKTTTLYSILATLNSVRRNIVTVEDPVEFRLPGINQVNSDSEYALGFANALKYFLRQDPDVILVGEIRDHETADTAIQASLTGHLLLSTLHTNDAVAAVTRLVDLGVDRFKIAGALIGSIAQRLLRSLCRHCKEPYKPNENMLKSLTQDHPLPADAVFFHGRGCKQCLNSGYGGRVPVFEIMEVTSEIVSAIEDGLPGTQLRELALANGMGDLRVGGLHQALAGRTTIEEVYYKVAS